MTNKRLLLLSNSTNYGERYLGYPADAIKEFLGAEIKRVLFVPFAGVRFSFDEYAKTVLERFEELGYQLESVHEVRDSTEAVSQAEAIAVGGGNTFHLLRGLYESKLIGAIRARVEQGAPYIGWSAGSNVACPTIRTTNDMPIVEPPSLDALNLIPFQINPHYTDATPTGHAGETRDERLQEFIEVNPDTYVVGLREGTMLRIEDSSIKLLGEKSARVFIKGREAKDYTPQESLQFLLEGQA
ncbi:MAG TPA: dipeptidase PepE [Pyrinomonadaceae bacterium]|jgi:dipeptidase E|nr:dipeptidase PepE [Pyrinomonadaceae bacterium]